MSYENGTIPRRIISKRQKASTLSEKIAANIAISRFLIENGELEKAGIYLDESVDMLSNSSESHAALCLWLALLYHRLNHPNQGIHLVKTGLREEKEKNNSIGKKFKNGIVIGALYKLQGAILFDQGRYDRSEDSFNKAKIRFHRSGLEYQEADSMLWEIKAILKREGLLDMIMNTSFKNPNDLDRDEIDVIDDCLSRLRQAVKVMKDSYRPQNLISRLIFGPRLSLSRIWFWHRLLFFECSMEWNCGYYLMVAESAQSMIDLGFNVKQRKLIVEGRVIRARSLTMMGKSNEAVKLLGDALNWLKRLEVEEKRVISHTLELIGDGSLKPNESQLDDNNSNEDWDEDFNDADLTEW